MKKIILISLLFSFTCVLTFAQKGDWKTPNEKIFERYDSERYSRSLEGQHKKIVYLNYLLTDGYQIIEKVDLPFGITTQKLTLFERDNKTRNWDSLNNFNLFNYNFKVEKNSRVYYAFPDNSKILVVFSKNEIVSAIHRKYPFFKTL